MAQHFRTRHVYTNSWIIKPYRSERAVEGASPYILFRQIRCAAKLLRSLRVLRCAMGWKKRCRVLCSDTALILLLVCFSSIAFLHRFCRLAPIEALPQAPQGTLSLDPASPLTPGLSLRFISRYARCCLLLRTCALLCSALPIPHSSFLIPHFLTPHFSLPLVHFAIKSY